MLRNAGRDTSAARSVDGGMGGRRHMSGVSELSAAQQAHTELWHTCLARQLRESQLAIEVGETRFRTGKGLEATTRTEQRGGDLCVSLYPHGFVYGISAFARLDRNEDLA